MKIWKYIHCYTCFSLELLHLLSQSLWKNLDPYWYGNRGKLLIFANRFCTVIILLQYYSQVSVTSDYGSTLWIMFLYFVSPHNMPLSPWFLPPSWKYQFENMYIDNIPNHPTYANALLLVF